MRGSSQSYFSFPPIAGHNSWLDALRALAIVLVLFRHGSRIEGVGFASGSFGQNVFSNGWIGVDLFFVLSGYLIAKSLFKRLGKDQQLFSWRYFEARILRIVPAYYAVLLLCVIGFFPFFQVSPEGLEQRFFYHGLFLQDYFGADINVVFWSLGVEEKFYILVPLLILALLRIKSVRWQFAACLVIMSLSPIARFAVFAFQESIIGYQEFFTQLRSPFHMSLEGFLVGIMVALGERKNWLLPVKIAKPVLLLCLVGLVLWAGSHEFMASINLFDAVLQPLLLSLFFGLMLYCCLGLNNTLLPLEPTARVIARLSYALYLVHFPLIPLVLVLTKDLGGWAFWSLYLLFSMLGAMALHFLVEKPFLKLKDRPGLQTNPGSLRTAKTQ